ncbi:trimeric intracellular cation channel family protein [Buchananella hordeovulneris]|uniref:TRIC cation channel family protein n=1 Tax=Buchananella hordeovulneris TaxID=52770 RepID=UPI000F5EDAAB|nr:TRIC cation channel family protein [Buchananella hordeovulneris]RRD52937.1 trimeric intracellular cation channel family protein [Buchananella hordeovulneris]
MLDSLNASLPDLFRFIDLTGVLLNGTLGGKLARQKGFDAVGFAILAIMTSMAGGMVRDTLLQAGPPFALTDPYYIGMALVGATVAMLFRLDSKWAARMLVVADGVVLGCWSATGAIKTLQLGFGVFPAIMLGVMTAIGGGMIRDVMSGSVPNVFGGNNLYAVPAITASGVMVAFFRWDLPMLGMLVSTIVGAVFTSVAHWRRWQLPRHSGYALPEHFESLRQRARVRALARSRGESAAAVAASTNSPASPERERARQARLPWWLRSGRPGS